MIGSRLGPYEVTAKLGEGGMGEVYRATDTKLKREVAIKVLPAIFTEDRERLARFEREAQLLAQLHHPHIASIFGLEESSGVRALVMELVEGPTLEDRIQKGPIPLEETLVIARQIAEALEEAHEKGIVHRDLKPANVKLTSDDNVKVLDFGLAKALDTASGSGPSASNSPTLMNSPTLTAAGTQLGVILGTAAYMAPEQAKGAAVDKRADIWAFGAVLFEMLTGRRLFEGDSVAETLAEVLKQEIDFAQLPDATPAALRQLLRRCLERQRRNRLHDIGDARIVLEELERGAIEEADPLRPGDEKAASTRVGRAVVATAAAALAIGLGAGWLLHRSGPVEIGAGARWALAIPDGFTLSTDLFPQIALSEDGRLQAAVVVDAGLVSRLLLRSSEELEPRLLPDTEGAASPFFSPDGRWIAFFRDRALYKISAAGGPPIALAPIPSASLNRGGTWSRDGYIYFTLNVATGLSRVSENGGPVSEVTKPDPESDERTHRWPQALPDGSAVLFTCDTFASTEYYDDAWIEAVRPATGERKRLVEGASQARYATGDRLVFARGGSLFSVAFEPRALTVHGSPELVVQGVVTNVGSGAVQFALSPSGAALWVPGGLEAYYRLFWVDRNGVDSTAGIPPAPYNEAELSPDGTKVALVGGMGGAADLWVADLERGAQTRISSGESVLNPVWSPDGSRVVYVVRRQGDRHDRRWQIAWKPADGSRDEEILIDSDKFLSPSGFTGDGKKLLYSAFKSDLSGTTLYLLPVTGTRTPEPFLNEPFSLRDAVISPDGHFLAYASGDGGQSSVFVRPFPTGDGRWQISTGPGVEPRWSRDQKEIYYRTPGTSPALYQVAIDTRSGFSVGKPALLFDRVSAAGTVHSYAPAPDGRRFFTSRSPSGRGSSRTLFLDLGFARRLAAVSRANASQP